MKRTFIRIFGTVLASVAGVLGKNQAFAACSVQAVRDSTVQAWIATGCSNSGVVSAVCKGGKGQGTVWEAATGDYAGYCWCKNVSSNGMKGDIACQQETGAYEVMFNKISGGCSFTAGNVAVTTDTKYYGACVTSTDACYYDSSSDCAKGYSTTGEVASKLGNCCKPCHTGIGPITGLTVNGDEYIANWTVSNNGQTGINTCVYSASSVQDKYGTFVAGNGSSYTCYSGASVGSGSGTVIVTPGGTGTGS